jgi:hypothetical protein
MAFVAELKKSNVFRVAVAYAVVAWLVLSWPHTAPAADDIQTCGEISVLVKPPETQRMYFGYIHAVDGQQVFGEQHTFRLAPGGYEIALHELISDPWLRRTSGIQKAKLLLLNVERGKRYDLAAKFLVEKRGERHDEGYWEPVVWRITDIKCKGRTSFQPQ